MVWCSDLCRYGVSYILVPDGIYGWHLPMTGEFFAADPPIGSKLGCTILCCHAGTRFSFLFLLRFSRKKWIFTYGNFNLPLVTEIILSAINKIWRTELIKLNDIFIISVQVFHFSQLEQKLTWMRAHNFCRKHGANLLSISGPEEEQFVLQILHEAFGCVWIVV